ncbi:MAG: oxygenase MpaB family protein [Parcubacteria group bacterium]
MSAFRLPQPLQARLETGARELLEAGGPRVDFEHPAGEPALVGPDSVSWQVFRNPVALIVGGITAVLLELAEPRVRHGVWDHTTSRTDPLRRMRRTGLAAMVTVYGARSTAEAMIAGVGRMHARVAGHTPAGAAYAASDPELLDWVQATAAYGFLEAYSAFVRPISRADKDRYYGEGRAAAALYGATGAPGSLAELEAQFAAMRPKLERSEIVFEFLDILHRTDFLPPGLKPFRSMFIRAAVEILPDWTRDTLGLQDRRLRPWETGLIRLVARIADTVVVEATPASAACRRLGLPSDYLQRHPV